MDYCAPRGVPHSTFLGWSELDRDKAVEWLVRERSRCPGCGVPSTEWDPDHGGDPNAYVAEAHRCVGCEKLQILKVDEKRDGKGMRKRLVPSTLLEGP